MIKTTAKPALTHIERYTDANEGELEFAGESYTEPLNKFGEPKIYSQIIIKRVSNNTLYGIVYYPFQMYIEDLKQTISELKPLVKNYKIEVRK
jgi:hypothetical protein